MHYRHNHLTKVVLRLAYEPVAELSALTDITTRPAFSDRIVEKFPNVQGLATATLLINIGPGGSGVAPQAAATQWIHRKTENGTSFVVLAPDFAAIEYGRN